MNPDTPLHTFRLTEQAAIARASPWNHEPVTLDSPAIRVMTDLSRIKAATIDPRQSLREAEQNMLYLGVRMLFVVSAMPRLEGVITTVDLHGEKALQRVSERMVGRDELRVADLMTPLYELEAVDLDELTRARVGNLIATLKRHGRNHLLAVQCEPDGMRMVRGVVSRAQIERQLGKPVQIDEIADSFAEIERALI
ncbi:MAG: hypothetical protein R3E48_00135 [Burkholderiaceae bacterium]